MTIVDGLFLIAAFNSLASGYFYAQLRHSRKRADKLAGWVSTLDEANDRLEVSCQIKQEHYEKLYRDWEQLKRENDKLFLASYDLGAWMSAALDGKGCDEFKRDINAWFDAWPELWKVSYPPGRPKPIEPGPQIDLRM